MKKVNIEFKLFGLKLISFEYSKMDNEVKQAPDIIPLEFNKRPKTIISNNISNGTIRPDLKELEKQVLNKEEVPAPIKVKCKTCDGTTYDDDIDFCNKCGKEICSNCGSLDTDGHKYCSECWSKL